MSDGELAAREQVSRILTSSRSASAGDAEAARSAFQRTTNELVRWVGPTGCAALQQRALASARQRHPILAAFRIDESQPRLIGSAAGFGGDADSSLASAIEDVMVQLFHLLSRLIGPELCASIADQIIAAASANDVSNPEEGSLE